MNIEAELKRLRRENAALRARLRLPPRSSNKNQYRHCQICGTTISRGSLCRMHHLAQLAEKKRKTV